MVLFASFRSSFGFYDGGEVTGESLVSNLEVREVVVIHQMLGVTLVLNLIRMERVVQYYFKYKKPHRARLSPRSITTAKS